MNGDSCAALIKQIHCSLERDANNGLRPHGLTVAQLGVLIALHEAPNGRLTLKELEHHLHVAQSTAVGLVARLEQKGFVEGASNPADQRVKVVCLTALGLQTCHEANRLMDQAETDLLSGLTPDERVTLNRLLRKVCATR